MPPETALARTVAEARAACDGARARGLTVGFVPTMGALHDGHLALVGEAKRRAAFVVVSIFVNPTQFGPHEDLARYPRDIEGDLAKLAPLAANLVFAPDATEMYPPGDQTRVDPGALATPLEGALRPGHFEGVATVVAKLFAVVGPCSAVFGRKDYQQLLVVRRMVRDLFLPVEVVGHPIVRDRDGLAMSSRNRYLSAGERRQALDVVRGLDAAATEFDRGERRASRLTAAVRDLAERSVTSIDYVALCDADTLAATGDEVSSRALLAAAWRVGSTRLIDNVVLGEDRPPLEAPGASSPAPPKPT
jgi:pantoate--beta-alanine ligase